MYVNKKIQFDILLGEFGVVYKGDLQHNYADNVRDAVAVKTLKGIPSNYGKFKTEENLSTII